MMAVTVSTTQMRTAIVRGEYSRIMVPVPRRSREGYAGNCSAGVFIRCYPAVLRVAALPGKKGRGRTGDVAAPAVSPTCTSAGAWNRMPLIRVLYQPGA